MDEREALTLLEAQLDPVGDDAAVIDGQVLTTDMLHEATDFPDGTDRYTAGWRAVGASLSDVAAMGAAATAAVAVYAAPSFDRDELLAFVRGASDVCADVDAQYVGGDLDGHREFTVVSTALGRTDGPIYRRGARPGDAVVVTGSLGCSAAAVELFDREEIERANELFRFAPRVDAGRALASHASAMMDSSDGLVRSVHQLAEASDVGVALDSTAIPIADSLRDVSTDHEAAFETAITFGEDFELVATVPSDALDAALEACPIALAVVGEVREASTGITLDGGPLTDRGYTHG